MFIVQSLNLSYDDDWTLCTHTNRNNRIILAVSTRMFPIRLIFKKKLKRFLCFRAVYPFQKLIVKYQITLQTNKLSKRKRLVVPVVTEWDQAENKKLCQNTNTQNRPKRLKREKNIDSRLSSDFCPCYQTRPVFFDCRRWQTWNPSGNTNLTKSMKFNLSIGRKMMKRRRGKKKSRKRRNVKSKSVQHTHTEYIQEKRQEKSYENMRNSLQ